MLTLPNIFKSHRASYENLPSLENDPESLDLASSEPSYRDNTVKNDVVLRNSVSIDQPRSRSIYTVAIALLIGIAVGFLGSRYSPFPSSLAKSQSGNHIRQFAPEMPTKTVTFTVQPELMDPPSEDNQRYWDNLLPTGRGFVNISNPQEYHLKPGITTESGIDRYSVAMYHQLHCLEHLRRGYFRLVDAIGEPSIEDSQREKLLNHITEYHAEHCFGYLAQSIMCSADLTIEWARVEKADGRRIQVEGWGVPHQCKDPDEVRAWAEANHGPTGRPHHSMSDKRPTS